MLTILYVLIVVVLLCIAFFVYMLRREQQWANERDWMVEHYHTREEQLLDRVMARDYEQFRVFSPAEQGQPHNMHTYTDEEDDLEDYYRNKQ